VRAIPFTLLIGRDGTIAAVNPRGETLDPGHSHGAGQEVTVFPPPPALQAEEGPAGGGKGRLPPARSRLKPMFITALRIAGYRSVREVELELGRINVLVGANGCGKSNLYRGMFLLHAAAAGELARTLAAEGGMPSVLWAGARKKGPVRMSLGACLETLDYALSCGLPEINDCPHRSRSTRS
jgi:hypothetical protein